MINYARTKINKSRISQQNGEARPREIRTKQIYEWRKSMITRMTLDCIGFKKLTRE